MALYKSVYYYYFFDPGTQFPGNEKITLCNIIIIIIKSDRMLPNFTLVIATVQ